MQELKSTISIRFSFGDISEQYSVSSYPPLGAIWTPNIWFNQWQWGVGFDWLIPPPKTANARKTWTCNDRIYDGLSFWWVKYKSVSVEKKKVESASCENGKRWGRPTILGIDYKLARVLYYVFVRHTHTHTTNTILPILPLSSLTLPLTVSLSSIIIFWFVSTDRFRENNYDLPQEESRMFREHQKLRKK